MMNAPNDSPAGTPGSVFSYTFGFLISIILTLIAFICVSDAQFFLHAALVLTLIGLAVVQIAVQLFLFLHFADRHANSRYTIAAFLLMLLILAIIVVGSLWIMTNLDANMMPATPAEWDAFLANQE